VSELGMINWRGLDFDEHGVFLKLFFRSAFRECKRSEVNIIAKGETRGKSFAVTLGKKALLLFLPITLFLYCVSSFF
jgi:hypothetical protein